MTYTVIFPGAQQQAPYDPTEDRTLAKNAMEDTPWYQKGIINLGAGLNNVLQGAKSLVGQGQTPDQIQRERAMNEGAAQGQAFGGATQFAGEMLPSLAIPMGAVGTGLRAGGNIVRGALGRTLLDAVPKFGSLASAGEGAVIGGLQGATQEVMPNESRAKNVIGAATLGAAIPGGVGAFNAASSAVTKSGAAQRAASELIDVLGGNDAAQEVLDKLHGPPGVAGPLHADEIYPRSTADVAGSTALAGAERQNRIANTTPWANFDALANEGKYSALKDATSESTQLDALKTARADKTDPMREAALQKAGGDPFFQVPVVNQVMQIYNKNSVGTKPYQLAKFVENALSDGITPDKLYSVRKTLTDALQGPLEIGNATSSAVKGANVAAQDLVSSIDASLNKGTGGAWSRYTNTFSNMSKPVESAQASGNILAPFESEGASPAMGVGGIVPQITSSKLGNVVQREGTGQFGDKLSPNARGALTNLLGALQGTEALQKSLKLAGTMGGGSNTPMDLAASAAKGALNAKTGGVAGMLSGAWDAMRRPGLQSALTDALQNPQVFARGIEQKLQQSVPLTTSEQAILTALRSLGTTSGAMLAGPNGR